MARAGRHTHTLYRVFWFLFSSLLVTREGKEGRRKSWGSETIKFSNYKLQDLDFPWLNVSSFWSLPWRLCRVSWKRRGLKTGRLWCLMLIDVHLRLPQSSAALILRWGGLDVIMTLATTLRKYGAHQSSASLVSLTSCFSNIRPHHYQHKKLHCNFLKLCFVFHCYRGRLSFRKLTLKGTAEFTCLTDGLGHSFDQTKACLGTIM